MIRAMHARSCRLRLLMTAVLAPAVALGCAGPTPATAPVDGSAAASGPAAPPSVDAAACAVETPPGPDDTVPDPGEIDTTDLGNGRWRLCLAEPAVFEAEGSAWCTWNADRTEVREAAGLPVPTGASGSTVDGGIAIDQGVVYLASNDPRMVFSWQGEPSDMSAVVGVGGRNGTVAFRIPATVDPENPPALRPPDAAGVLSWQCGEPPPPG
jgi:hypothetical protein